LAQKLDFVWFGSRSGCDMAFKWLSSARTGGSASTEALESFDRAASLEGQEADMLKKTVSVIAIAAGLDLAPLAAVQAQTTPTPPAQNQPAQDQSAQPTPPATTTPNAQTPSTSDSGSTAQAPSTPGSTGQTADNSEGKPVDGQITMQQEGTYLGTDLIGTTVYSAGNEDIGDVADVIIGTDGRIQGVVVGVGGFLGIGQKDVAIQMDKVQMQDQGDNTAKLIVNASREELEQAPEFRTVAEMQSDNNNATTTGNTPMTGTGTGTGGTGSPPSSL